MLQNQSCQTLCSYWKMPDLNGVLWWMNTITVKVMKFYWGVLMMLPQFSCLIEVIMPSSLKHCKKICKLWTASLWTTNFGKVSINYNDKTNKTSQCISRQLRCDILRDTCVHNLLPGVYVEVLSSILNVLAGNCNHTSSQPSGLKPPHNHLKCISSAEMELLQGDWSIFLAHLSKKEEKYSTQCQSKNFIQTCTTSARCWRPLCDT